VYESQFKLVLAALLLVDVGIRLYYQRGRKKFEKATVKYERREKILYYLVALGLIPIFFYILTSWIDTFGIPLPQGVRWLGATLIFAGDILFIWSHKVLGRNWSPILEIRKGHILVTDGPYKFIRHPMYAAIFLIGIGVSLLSANWIVALTYLLPTTSLYLVRVSDEEEMMIGQFGDKYREYMTKTGRLIPKLSILKNKNKLA
jgi:protein-S-isoprenylcysteine O-methyltransferase Ste14